MRRLANGYLAGLILTGLLLAGCGSSNGHTHATHPGGSSATTTCTIPQNNGGDHDADNNGGPSDGDGCDI